MFVRAAVWLAAVALAGACTNPFGRQYEYEEQIYLSVDGTAEIIVNTSVAALVALRGISVGTPGQAPDRDAVRNVLQQAGCPVERVGRPWRRHERHYVQIRLAATPIAALANCPILSWSRYSLEPFEDGLRYTQQVGPPSGATPPGVVWRGHEIVAFRLHVPSRVRFHNVRRLEDGTAGEFERGNIGSWEQTLADRQAGKPMDIEVRMDAQSILRRTLWLFFGAVAAAVLTMLGVVWLVRRRGARSPRA
jgi:hypothetical protein